MLTDSTSNYAVRLGVNIDHVATIRQARGTTYPDPIIAAQLAEQGGADGITLHIREDRRHIQEHDLRRLQENNPQRYINLEVAMSEKMIGLALLHKPQACCIVPEKRQELTTEGGLDVIKNHSKIKTLCTQLKECNINVSLFIDPIVEQVEAAKEIGVSVIEIHTGKYSEYQTNSAKWHEALNTIQTVATHAHQLDLVVNAGHGLHYENVKEIADIAEINELNIGHAIVSESIMIGFKQAVYKMRKLIR